MDSEYGFDSNHIGKHLGTIWMSFGEKNSYDCELHRSIPVYRNMVFMKQRCALRIQILEIELYR